MWIQWEFRYTRHSRPVNFSADTPLNVIVRDCRATLAETGPSNTEGGPSPPTDGAATATACMLRHVRQTREPTQLRRGPGQVLSRLYRLPARFVLAANAIEKH